MKRSVVAYCTEVMEVIKTSLPTVRTVNIWTDGPSSQYKNKFIFSFIPKLVDKYSLAVSWNYFATSHGKGPHVALGGNVKRMAHRQVLSRCTVINDAQSFANAVKMANTNILVSTMSEETIAARCADLGVEDLWKSAPAIPGTINMHCIVPIGDTIHCRFFTSSNTAKIVHMAKLTPVSADVPLVVAEKSKR
jgi:hypothetical protein